MRRANEVTIGERHPIPTVKELLQDLNGSIFFGKIDLKWGFHQILFGVTSAPEKYQQVIRDVLRDAKVLQTLLTILLFIVRA